MTYIVMPSVVCCADAFSAGKSRRNREKTLRTVRYAADVPCKAVSKLLKAKATVRSKADDVSKAG